MNNIRFIKESEIPPLSGVPVKRDENPLSIKVKKMIEAGKPPRGKAIEISCDEFSGSKPTWIKAQSFAIKIKAFAQKNNFPVSVTWRKVGAEPERYKVYIYRTKRK